MTFANAFETYFALKHDIKKVLGMQVLLRMIGDGKCLFDLLTKPTCTTELTLMIDKKTFRDVYQSLKITNVALERSQYNVAEALTKQVPKFIMIDVLWSGKLDHPIKQQIICSS